MMAEINNNHVEHRKFLRLNAQVVGEPTCKILLEPDKTVELNLTDISPGGFGATIHEYLGKHFQKEREFPHCQINITGLQDVSARVADIWRLRAKTGETSLRVGFEFTSPINWVDTGLDACEINEG